MNHWLSPTLLLCLLACFSCSKEQETLYGNDLAGYIQSYSEQYEVSGNVLAFAARTPAITPGLDSSIAVYFKPQTGSFDFNLFLANGSETALSDYSAYSDVGFIDTDPRFGGMLKIFPLEDATLEQWAIVTFVKDSRIHISEPIQLRGSSRPTEYSGEVTISGSPPTFCWSDGTFGESQRYLQVIQDEYGNLVSGTFTEELCYTHNNWDNVTLNLTDPDAETGLESFQPYRFTLMGLSADNWVNLVLEETFTAP